MASRMMFFFSHQFSPQRASRRLSSAALLRTRNPALRRDDFALKCLAYESFRLVQDSGIRFYMPRERLGRDSFILYCAQIFGQYIINQYILQNTVEIICKEKVFFDEKETTGEKKIWGLTNDLV